MVPAIKELSLVLRRTRAESVSFVLGWNVLLAFGVIALAAMQGTLVMESSDPCRMSYKKFVLLLWVLAVEVVVMLATEAYSFAYLLLSLRRRLQWLLWISPCLLGVGILELFADVWLTIRLAAASRVYWLPFSLLGKRGSGWIQLSLEVVPPLMKTAMLVMLVGWRQGWWLVADFVSVSASVNSAKRSVLLSVGMQGFCVGFGSLLTVVLAVMISWEEAAYVRRGIGLLSCIVRALNPRVFFAKHPNENALEEIRENEKSMIETWRAQYTLEHGVDVDEHVDDIQVKRFLQTAPIHIRNTVVGPDKPRTRHRLRYAPRILLALALMVLHVATFPMQVCVVALIALKYDSLDPVLTETLRKLVDLLIVLVVFEIAAGFKILLWSAHQSEQVHEKDKALGDL